MAIPLPKLRELKEAVIALIRGPYTDKFPAAEARVARNYRGFPDYHVDDCMGCGACFRVCPPGAIDMTDDADARMRTLLINIDRCITCGQCQANCPTKKGILNGREYDLTTTVRADLQQRKVEKELIVCEACNEIVGPREQILWVARRLGPLAYANPTLMLTALRDMGAVPEPRTDIEKGLRRGDKVRILCPRCRQEVSFLA